MEMVRSTISAFFITFIKTFSLKSLTENRPEIEKRMKKSQNVEKTKILEVPDEK